MEAMILLDCSHYSADMVDVLKVFQQIGWDVYNPQGQVEYVPVGDDDEFNWQCDELSEIEVYEMMTAKIANKEVSAMNLFYNKGHEGICFLAHNTAEVMLSLSINRRTVDGEHTDMAWYLENIIYKLWRLGVRIISYKAEEFED
ncbi:MAG: hypothetical protein IJ379_11750 [Lachnospiraceae bacterium]|nr:hypothetical protein [Lachnospiraceae bacterium]